MQNGDDHAHVVIFPPLLFAICLLAGLALHLLMPRPRAFPPVVRLAGGVLAPAAVAFAVWGRHTLAGAGTTVHPDGATTTIVSAGPYAFTRNPLYLSLIALLIGLAVASGSIAMLAMAIPLALVLNYGVVAREEAYLERKFGAAYLGYKALVRRWL